MDALGHRLDLRVDAHPRLFQHSHPPARPHGVAMTGRRGAFFDMDHTLLRTDTGMSWTLFLYRRGELPASMVAKAIYWSALYKLAVLDMETVFTRLCRDL